MNEQKDIQRIKNFIKKNQTNFHPMKDESPIIFTNDLFSFLDSIENDRSISKEIEKWSSIYRFSFQFWGEYYNNVWIYKDNIELYDSGGHETMDDAVKDALNWVYRVNNIEKKL